MKEREPATNARNKPHAFAKLPEFDAALRKLIKVPKEAVEAREKKARTPRGEK